MRRSVCHVSLNCLERWLDKIDLFLRDSIHKTRPNPAQAAPEHDEEEGHSLKVSMDVDDHLGILTPEIQRPELNDLHQSEELQRIIANQSARDPEN
jgi:hypothetical protein